MVQMAVSAPHCPAVHWRGAVSVAERIFCRCRFSGVPAGVYRGFFSLLPPLLLFDPVPVRHPGPIPSNISALAGGVLFGTWVSFLLTFSAVAAGSLLVFSLARGLGRDAVTRLVGQKVSEKYLDVIHAKTDIFLVLAFLFPFFPDDVLCILAGLTQISFRRFAGIILCTRPWGLLFASALGGASFSIPAWGMALIGAAGLLLFLLGMKYGDRAEAAILRRLRRNSHS